MIDKLRLPTCEVELPAFFPDATYGAVRAAGFEDVVNANLAGLEMNGYHLYARIGAKRIKALGGLHAFTGYKGAILTDSGGFQLYSLIRENPAYGEIRDKEILFRPDMGDEKLSFTPEKCIQAQFMYASDMMMALDLCTHPNDPPDIQRRSVELTVRWARACRKEYDKLVKGAKGARPMLLGIVQGGSDPELRRECGERLEEIGFDGYGFGGWPTDDKGNLRDDVLQMCASAMPDNKLKYAMGVGKPEEIARCVNMGYQLFDCVIPTREARHKRLYVFEDGQATPIGARRSDGKFYKYLHIQDEHYSRDARPIDETCDCALCKNHSRAYLRHLFMVNDPQAMRLATAHNLRFYGRLMELLRA